MRHLDLFSGIGGFALAAERVWPNIKHTFCDNDPFCQAVLKKHWPRSKIYGDIRALTNADKPRRERSKLLQQGRSGSRGRHQAIDLLTGGFPCQPFSSAGQRKGTADDRHLWPEMRRVIQEFSPTWVVGENVRGLLSIDGGMVFEQVCLDLEALGYEVQPFVIPACAVNAPHRRDRVWIVARNTKHDGRNGTKNRKSSNPRGDSDEEREDKFLQSPRPDMARTASINGWDENWAKVAARLCTLDDGLSDGLVRPRGWRNAALKAAGNAIVPQVAEQIFRAINNMDYADHSR